jgi:hypothetical protein
MNVFSGNIQDKLGLRWEIILYNDANRYNAYKGVCLSPDSIAHFYEFFIKVWPYSMRMNNKNRISRQAPSLCAVTGNALRNNKIWRAIPEKAPFLRADYFIHETHRRPGSIRGCVSRKNTKEGPSRISRPRTVRHGRELIRVSRVSILPSGLNR